MVGGAARNIAATRATKDRLVDALSSLTFACQKIAILSCHELGLEVIWYSFRKVYDRCLPRLSGLECHEFELRVAHGGHTGGAHPEIPSKVAAGTDPL